MDGARRFQFSVWNLMLAMVPLAVVFWLARASGAGWVVWLLALYVGCWPAVGALIGGWSGMGIGLAWLFVVSLYVYVVAGVVIMWSGFAQVLGGGGGGPLGGGGVWG